MYLLWNVNPIRTGGDGANGWDVEQTSVGQPAWAVSSASSCRRRGRTVGVAAYEPSIGEGAACQDVSCPRQRLMSELFFNVHL